MAFFDFLNPPAANIPLPQFSNYAPTGFGQAESGALGGIGNLGNFNQYAQYLPQAQAITGSLMNNPYAAYYQSGANTASGMGQQGATNAFGAGGNLMGAGYGLMGQAPQLFGQGMNLFQQAPNMFGMGNSIAQTAFDPQNLLYDRTLQQLQDQTRAGQAARGVATTPYGAGLENDALRKFNIDWQNNQLGRQVTGGQAAGTLYGQGGNLIGQGGTLFGQGGNLMGQGAGLIGQGVGLQSGGAGQYGTASGMPYSTYNTIGGNQFGALTNLGNFGLQATNIPQQQITDWQNYLGWGTGQQNAGNQAQQYQFNDALNRDKQSFDQQSSIFGGIGKAIGAAAPYALAMFSDIRVKEDVVPVGELYDRTPVYSFRYKGDVTPRVGLMAQDVERRRPDAVSEFHGIKMVDYGKATEFSRGIAALSSWG